MAQGDTLLVHATKATLTCAFQGTANAAARAATAIATSGALDVLLRIRARLAGAGTGALEVYVAGALNDGEYVDGASGTDEAFTAANRINAPLCGYIQMNGTTEVIGIVNAAAAFPGGTLPRQIVFILVNRGGAAIDADAADFEAEYQLVYGNTTLT